MDFKKDLNLLLKSPPSWNRPSKSYVYYELNQSEIQLKNSQKEKKEQKEHFEAEKMVLLQEINQLEINYQHLQQFKDEQITELENKLNLLIERVMKTKN